ncbi:MAG: dockerin type I domain-containing protein [Candidatus Bathyarchaeales archaeon]
MRSLLGFLILALIFTTTSGLIVQAVSEPSLTEVLGNAGFTNLSKINSTDVTFPAGRYRITLLAEFAQYHNANVLSYYKVGTSEYDVIFDDSEGNFGYVTPPISKVFMAGSEFGLSIYVTPKYSHFPGDCNHDGEVNVTDADMMQNAWQSRGEEEGYLPEVDLEKDGIINIKDVNIICINWLKKWINRYYTQNSLNPDGQIHSAVYQNLDDPITYIIGFENAYSAGSGEFQDIVVSLKFEPPPSVVPEVPFGTIVTMAGMIAALASYVGIRRHKPRIKG